MALVTSFPHSRAATGVVPATSADPTSTTATVISLVGLMGAVAIGALMLLAVFDHPVVIAALAAALITLVLCATLALVESLRPRYRRSRNAASASSAPRVGATSSKPR